MTSRKDSPEEIQATLDALTLECANLKAMYQAMDTMVFALISVLTKSDSALPQKVDDLTWRFGEFKEVQLLNEAAELELEFFKREMDRISSVLAAIKPDADSA